MRQTILLNISTLAASIALLLMPQIAQASPVIQVTTGVESARFVDGLDITDGKPTITLASDLSLDNGVFAGLNCYKAEDLFFRDGIDAGCNYYLGYFQSVAEEQAISATLSRSQYAPSPVPRQWNYNTAALRWHTNRSTVISLTTTDDWFGRGFSSFSLSAEYEHVLSDQWSASIELSHIEFGAPARVTSIDQARIGLNFERGRWSSKLELHLSDQSLDTLTSIDAQQPGVSLSVSYRLY